MRHSQLLQPAGKEAVCTHRLADEHMWAEALAAGALDCCFDDDWQSIVRALNVGAPMTMAAAA